MTTTHTTTAKLFVVAQIQTVGEQFLFRVHHVAATCSAEAEDVFKADFGVAFSKTDHFYVYTDELMERSEQYGTHRTSFYADTMSRVSMTEGDYTRWIMAQAQVRPHGEDGTWATYRRFEFTEFAEQPEEE